MANPESDGLTPVDQVSPAGPEDEEGRQGQTELKPYQKIIRSRQFIPSVIVAALVIFVLASPRMAGSPPRLESITPNRGKPGDVMIITGRNFGSSRETSEVRISGVSPTSQDYLEWTDTRISMAIPDEVTSGIVYVLTKSGKSGGLLFISASDIPQLASGATRPGDPYIGSGDTPILPSAARVGDPITIYGMNFGLEKGGSEVYFTWAGQQSAASGSLDPANLQPARDYNLDYISWSDREIRLRVPDGAASGNVLVKSDKGTSNAMYFVVNKGVGSKSYTARRTYSVQYAMNITVSAASGDNTLYLWMPRILPTPEQRSIEPVALDPPSLLDTTAASLYSFTNLSKGGKHRVGMSWMFDRYAVETQVNAAEVPAYNVDTDLYKKFTAPDRLAPSASPDVMKAASAAAGTERNPWWKARRIYDWLVSQYTFNAAAADTTAALRTKQGNAFVFSSLYCALLRASGIPARMVAGYLVRGSGSPAQRHFWDEFYVETVGWVPVDPALGDDRTQAPSSVEDNRAYYFGNLDNQHITFTKGLEEISQMNPAGVTKSSRELPCLLSINEEAVGGLASYATSFEDLTVTGTY